MATQRRGTFEVEEAQPAVEKKEQQGLGKLPLPAQIGVGVGVLVFGVLLGALIFPKGGSKEAADGGSGGGGGGGAIESAPTRFSVHGGAPFHAAFWLEHKDKAEVLQHHGDWFSGASTDDDEAFKKAVSAKLRSYVPENLKGAKVDFVDVTAADKEGTWGWIFAGNFSEVTKAADFTFPEETAEVGAALEKVSTSLESLKMGGLVPFVEMVAMDKLQTRYIRELRSKIEGTLGDDCKFKVDVLPNIQDMGAKTDDAEESKYVHDFVFHVDIKDKDKVCARSRIEDCLSLPTTAYVEKVTKHCQDVVKDQLKATPMVHEKQCGVDFKDEGEADVGSDNLKTSFWIVDGLSCMFKEDGDKLKDISDALKVIEKKTHVPLGDVLSRVQDHQWEQYHVKETDEKIKSHLESEVGAKVDQVTRDTMKVVRRWEEDGRCCSDMGHTRYFWVDLKLLKASDGASTENMNDDDLEILKLSGLCPEVNDGEACAGEGIATTYANPLECSDGKLSAEIKMTSKGISKKCGAAKVTA